MIISSDAGNRTAVPSPYAKTQSDALPMSYVGMVARPRPRTKDARSPLHDLNVRPSGLFTRMLCQLS